MIGVLKTIFGGGDIIKSGFDLIDSMHTSDTEMIEAKTKEKTDMLRAYAPFKVAQRFLAVMFTLNFIGIFWAAVFLWATDKDIEGFLQIVAAFNFGTIMLAIVMFYFGGGAFESLGTAWKKGKEK